jgi:hypothetical protein
MYSFARLFLISKYEEESQADKAMDGKENLLCLKLALLNKCIEKRT